MLTHSGEFVYIRTFKTVINSTSSFAFILRTRLLVVCRFSARRNRLANPSSQRIIIPSVESENATLSSYFGMPLRHVKGTYRIRYAY